MKQYKTLNCKICGNEFVQHTRTQICCSKECTRQNGYNLARKSYWKHKGYDEVPEITHRKEIQRKEKTCVICGNPVEPELLPSGRMSSKRTHDNCIYSDCLKTLLEFRYLSGLQTRRLASRGYTIAEFKEALRNGELQVPEL